MHTTLPMARFPSSTRTAARRLHPTMWASVLFLLCLPWQALAQDGLVAGRVTAESGDPLDGIVLRLVDTQFGILTDVAGRYRLEAPAGDYQLEASGLGYSTVVHPVTIVAGQTTTRDFVLATRAIELREIVVGLAATVSTREQFGTDIGLLNVDEVLEDRAFRDFSDMMMSQVSGVTIAEGNGEVGAASKIRVRGATSLTQDNNPLVYIDGVRVSNETAAGPQSIDQGDGPTVSRLDDINPEDIADIQILKGPTAAAAYGSEAASGVVIITTKKGAVGAPEFRFSSEVLTATNPTEYEPNHYNLTANAGITDLNQPGLQQFHPVQNPVTGDIFARHNPLEWNDPFRTGVSVNGNLSVRGGAENLQYYGSAKYDRSNGPMTQNTARRTSVRANFTANPTSAIDVTFSSTYMDANVRTTGSGRSATNIIPNGLLGFPVFGYGRNPDGSRGECLATYLFGDDPSACDRLQGNILAKNEAIEKIVNRHTTRRFLGSAEVNVRATPWLTNRIVGGIDLIEARDLNLVPLDPERPYGVRSRGEIDDFRHSEFIVSFDYAGTVTTDPTDALSLTSTLGAQYFGRKRETLGCEGRGGFAGPNATACGASLTFDTSENIAEIVELGAYLQQTVGYDDYLFLTGALRVDDNSGFGANQGVIWSPSVNGSVVLSRMPFWNIDAVNNLRLRFAWGKAAQAPGPFDALTTFAPVRLDDGGTQITGISPLDPGNPDLKPERNEEFEGGFDASFWDDRLSLTFSYFNQTINDAIVGRRVSPGTGFSGQQFVNIAEVANEGVEAFLNARLVQSEDVNWDASVSFSTEDPVITDMGGLAPITGFFQLGGMFHEGFAPGAYFGPLYVGAERDENHEIIPGSVEFAPGNLDFPANPEFRYMGRPNPTNQQTLSTTLNLFGRLTVSTMFERRAGHRRMDDGSGSRNCFIPNISGGRLCAFRETLPPEVQAAMEEDIVDAPMIFVNDASFAKWRELTLRYQLPESLFARLGVDAASIAVGARNLATWTDFPGPDPESDISSGEDFFGNTGGYGTLAQSRMFFLRLNLSL